MYIFVINERERKSFVKKKVFSLIFVFYADRFIMKRYCLSAPYSGRKCKL